jgi:hypothetical protein
MEGETGGVVVELESVRIKGAGAGL